jgi:hypothetical protein
MQTRNDRCAPCYGRRANAPVSESHAQMTPGLSSMGEGRCAPDRFCLRQQTTATLATAGLLWPANARCKVRPFLKKEGRALQCPQRAQFIPNQSESYTVSPSAAN